MEPSSISSDEDLVKEEAELDEELKVLRKRLREVSTPGHLVYQMHPPTIIFIAVLCM